MSGGPMSSAQYCAAYLEPELSAAASRSALTRWAIGLGLITFGTVLISIAPAAAGAATDLFVRPMLPGPMSHMVNNPVFVSRASAEEDQPAPAGMTRFKVTLAKPFGMVLEEDGNGGIVVSEILEEGNAAKEGTIQVGDSLIATTALVYNTEQSYGSVTVKGGEQYVRVAVRGEKFDTIMAAIRTNPASVPPTLEFERRGRK
uniref:PDZ domain-containing protein n=1 Tax=Eutreptiella gymnastica TaxID=73025 RepID=A0A7S4GIG1_9EUGL